MTAREMLESYGALLSRDAALIRERKACLAHARNGPENAEHWIRRAKSLQAERNRVQRQFAPAQMRLMLATWRTGAWRAAGAALPEPDEL